MLVHNALGGLRKCVEVEWLWRKFLYWSYHNNPIWVCFSLKRFPYTALQYGGGTFLIPYTIIVVLVGRPIYYMEILLGQFSSKGCIKVYDIAPAVRGVGFGQCLCTIIVLSIYVSVMALTIRFLIASFTNPLPWSVCNAQWNITNCVDSASKGGGNLSASTNARSSAELYFLWVWLNFSFERRDQKIIWIVVNGLYILEIYRVIKVHKGPTFKSICYLLFFLYISTY